MRLLHQARPRVELGGGRPGAGRAPNPHEPGGSGISAGLSTVALDHDDAPRIADPPREPPRQERATDQLDEALLAALARIHR